MIKKIAWNTFKNTGSIDTFMEFKQIQEIENNILNNAKKVEIDGDNQNNWNNNFRK